MAAAAVKLDLSTVLGILLAFVLIFIAIGASGQLFAFVDVVSIVIVLGGTLLLTVACFTLKDVLKAHVLAARAVFYSFEDPQEAAKNALKIAEIARKEGVLALQKHEHLVRHNRFFERGIHFIIDGLPQEETEAVLSEQIDAMLERHRRGIEVLRKAGDTAPAMGLIGTLIGLIQMLGSLENPATIGPAMAIALLTTLYGAMLSFMVMGPLASKLERISRQEAEVMEIYLLTVNSIAKKENPRRLQMLVNSLLSPAKRVKFFT